MSINDLFLYDDSRDDWQARALCAETDPEAFFPELGESPQIAKRVCRRCEVSADCLEWALSKQIRHGIFGGLSPRERRPLAAARRRAARTAA